MSLWLLAAALASALGFECTMFHANEVARACGSSAPASSTRPLLDLDLRPPRAPAGGGLSDATRCSLAHGRLSSGCDAEQGELRRELDGADAASYPAVAAKVRVFTARYGAVASVARGVTTPDGQALSERFPTQRAIDDVWAQALSQKSAEVAASVKKAGDDPGGTVKKAIELSGGGAPRGGFQGASDQTSSSDVPLVAAAEAEMSKAGMTDPDSQAWLAREYQLAGSTAAAGRVLDAALRGDPRHAQSRGLRAVNRLAAGDPAGARDDARAALRRDPGNELGRQVLAYLSSAEAARGARAPAALKGLEPPRMLEDGSGSATPSAVRASPGAAGPTPAAAEGPALPPPARGLLAEARRKAALGDLTGALLGATRALQAEPGSVEAWALRAHLSNRAGNFDAALADAAEALRLSPGDLAARLEQAYALVQTGRASEALASLDGLLKEAPGTALAHLYRAMALEKLGRGAEAADAYREAARLDAALKPLAEEALKRLGAAPAAPKPSRAPLKPVLWIVLAFTAAGLLVEGLKRVFKPGWSTTGPRAESQTPPLPGGSTLPAGSLLAGNYRIDGELARGGMGIVYRGTDVLLKRQVAVKQLKRDLYDSEPARVHFLREAQLAAKLRHPNLAQIFAAVDEGELYLIFEFVEGQTLDRHLAGRGRLSIEEAIAVLAPVCEAVDYAHSQKVIHRDLKPANVMVGPGGCKVMDFGIAHEARTASAETRTEAWGTPAYMAPEQEAGVVSRLSDLYALGVMTYELLCGGRPFEGPGALPAKLERRYRPASERAPGLSSSVDAVLERALDPDPARRFASAGGLLAALRSCAGATPARPA